MASSISEEISTPSAVDELEVRPVSADAAETTSPLLRFSGRSPLASLTGVQILGTGAYLPETIVRNEDLGQLGCDADWIIQRTGIRERRHAAPHEATSDLAYEAAVRCLDNAGVAPRDVDLILVATMTPDMLTPSCGVHWCSVDWVRPRRRWISTPLVPASCTRWLPACSSSRPVAVGACW